MGTGKSHHLPSANQSPRKASGISSNLRAGGDVYPSSTVRQRELSLPPPFCSTQALDRLDDAHPSWGRQFALPSPPVHMLISSRNTLTETPRNNFSPALWVPHDLVQLTHTVNHHSLFGPLHGNPGSFMVLTTPRDQAPVHPSRILPPGPQHPSGPHSLPSRAGHLLVPPPCSYPPFTFHGKHHLFQGASTVRVRDHPLLTIPNSLRAICKLR